MRIVIGILILYSLFATLLMQEKVSSLLTSLISKTSVISTEWSNFLQTSLTSFSLSVTEMGNSFLLFVEKWGSSLWISLASIPSVMMKGHYFLKSLIDVTTILEIVLMILIFIFVMLVLYAKKTREIREELENSIIRVVRTEISESRRFTESKVEELKNLINAMDAKIGVVRTEISEVIHFIQS